MRKALLLFTTMALALLLAAGTAWAALPAPTVTNVALDANANITAQFSEPMNSKSFNISNKSTSTSSSTTFYLLEGHFTAPRPNKNPPYHCTTIGTRCPPPIPATVRYNALNKTAFILDPSVALTPNTQYTAVVEGTADGDYVAVKDSGGTAMATDYIFHFTTGGGPF